MEAHIKELLRRDGIKLWLAPFTVDGRQFGVYSADLIKRYAKETGRSSTEVETCLEKIRLQTVSRLNANQKFATSGVATLYVSKVIAPSDSQSSTDAQKGSDTNNHVSIECQLSALGHEFRALVAGAFSIQPEDFKLIGQARLIEDNRLLESQGIQHGTEMLCVVLTDEEKQAQREQTWRNSADLTRDAVKKLTKNETIGTNHLQITDQHGNPVQMPQEEREALALAMALHEKGRKALKRKQYGQALLFLLEADKEFELCRSNILQMVDNYAILCLDIVWCYLRLQSVNSLPDSERRLRLADEGFRRSYGRNFERLAKIRDGVMHEKALIIRLKLLQGALAYYQRNYQEANRQFVDVSKDIKALEVDDTKLSEIMAIGYSATEARLGLRATGGSIEGAVQRLIVEREQEEIREKEREREYHEHRLQKRFGATPSGKPLNYETYNKIVEMGFSKRASGEALRQADNDMNVALEILRVLPHIRTPGGELVEAIEDSIFNQHGVYTQDELIAQISSLGFPIDTVREAFRLYPRDIAAAVEALLSSGAPGPIQALLEANPGFRDDIMRVAHELQEHQSNRRRRSRRHSQQRNAASGSQNGSPAESADEVDGDQAAFDQLEADMANSLHEHLDTTFEEEMQVLEMLQPLVIPHLM